MTSLRHVKSRAEQECDKVPQNTHWVCVAMRTYTFLMSIIFDKEIGRELVVAGCGDFKVPSQPNPFLKKLLCPS